MDMFSRLCEDRLFQFRRIHVAFKSLSSKNPSFSVRRSSAWATYGIDIARWCRNDFVGTRSQALARVAAKSASRPVLVRREDVFQPGDVAHRLLQALPGSAARVALVTHHQGAHCRTTLPGPLSSTDRW